MPRNTKPKGLQTFHEVVEVGGNKRFVTQEEWQDRDKSAGWIRVDTVEVPEGEEPQLTNLHGYDQADEATEN